MLAGLAGIGLFSSLFNAITQGNANSQQQSVLNNLATEDQTLINEQQAQQAAIAAQPAQLATRSLQEQMNSDLQTKSSAFSNPLAISSLGGLKGKLG
jgi:predicted lipid-binding transport protein (Tim44 family)